MRKLITLALIIALVCSFTLIGYAGSDLNIDVNNISDKIKNISPASIEIINPATDIIYSDYLLISIKIKEQKSFKFSLYAHNDVNGTKNINVYPITSSGAIKIETIEKNDTMKDYTYLYGETINSTDFAFYTLQLEKLVPGKYKMSIEELEGEGKVTRTIYKDFEIKDKSEQPKEVINYDNFNEKPVNKLQTIQNFFKSIFGN